MSNVSPETTRKATEAIDALEANGIDVDGVVFDAESDTFQIELADGGLIGTQGLRGGTGKGGE